MSLRKESLWSVLEDHKKKGRSEVWPCDGTVVSAPAKKPEHTGREKRDVQKLLSTGADWTACTSYVLFKAPPPRMDFSPTLTTQHKSQTLV